MPSGLHAECPPVDLPGWPVCALADPRQALTLGFPSYDLVLEVPWLTGEQEGGAGLSPPPPGSHGSAFSH